MSSAKIGLWAALFFLSLLLAVVFHWAAVPAAAMLGPMLAGVLFALRGAELAVPHWAFAAAQAILGCLVAVSVTPTTLAALAQSWPVMLLVIVMVIGFGALTGLGLTWFGTLPGTTAAWGSSPGGAAAMTAMAASFGADIRMVAFMQYLRVFIVVITASGVSRLLLGHAIDAPATGWSPDLDAPLVSLIQTLALAAGGVILGRVLRIPAGAVLLPMLAGVALNTTGLMTITLPPVVLWCSYACLGWYIGLRFTPETVRYALRAVPQLLLSVGALMALSGAAAWMLHAWAGVDALSAYLATSPGGLDSVVVIAVGSGCDVPFILSLQTLRLFAVILLWPFVARFICRMGGSSPRPSGGGRRMIARRLCR